MDLQGELRKVMKLPRGLIPSPQGIAIIAVLVGINVISRVYLQFLPNIKPVTSIIILTVLVFGWRFGTIVAVLTVCVSNMILGWGIWSLGQIISWGFVATLTYFLAPHLKKNSNNSDSILLSHMWIYLWIRNITTCIYVWRIKWLFILLLSRAMVRYHACWR